MMSSTIQAFYQELRASIAASPNLSQEIRDEIAEANELIVHVTGGYCHIEYLTKDGSPRKFTHYARQDGGFMSMSVYNG